MFYFLYEIGMAATLIYRKVRFLIDVYRINKASYKAGIYFITNHTLEALSLSEVRRRPESII